MNGNPDFDLLMCAGVEFGRQGRHKDALASFDRALAINPRDNQAWANKGHALQSLSRHSEAKICYKRALELNPTDEHALLSQQAIACCELGVSLDLDGQKENTIDRGISLLKEAVSSIPDDIAVRMKLFSACLKNDQVADFLSCFEELIKHLPDWPQFHYDLLDKLKDLGHAAIIETSFEESIKSDPDNYVFHYGYGLIQQAYGNQDKAIEEFLKVIQIMPSFASGYLNLGIAYANNDQIDTAMEYLEQAKANNNKMPEIYFMLGKLNQSINPINAAIHFDLFIDLAYPYLAKSSYIQYAKMHVQNGKKMFDGILLPVSGEKSKKEKETCPKCGKQVEKLAVLQDANKMQYFLCDDCCLKVIGERSFTVRDPHPGSKIRKKWWEFWKE